jgi:mycothiol synthase
MGILGERVIPCPAVMRPAALEVLYRRMPSGLRGHLITEVLEDARKGDLDLSGLWVAQARSGRIVGAMMTQALAGKAAAVWAPEMKASWRRSALAAELVEAAMADLTARGYRLAQAVLDESAGPQAGQDLTRGGMPRVAELLYLERDTATPMAPAGGLTRGTPGPAFLWRPFNADVEVEFRAVLEATYSGSLDMPELEGTRGLDDILDGHRAAGLFVPEHWRLGRIAGEPESAAVLLMAEVPGRDAWEVIYLGLTPAARGRGLGRAVLCHALELARAHTPRLELAVDLRNTPAVHLYRDTGFVIRNRRTVHLAILGR